MTEGNQLLHKNYMLRYVYQGWPILDWGAKQKNPDCSEVKGQMKYRGATNLTLLLLLPWNLDEHLYLGAGLKGSPLSFQTVAFLPDSQQA